MMKRVIACLVFAAFCALPALAAAEVGGVYIAPRFLVGFQNAGLYNVEMGPEDSFSSTNKTVFGGALAVGYNFAPSFRLPFRAELELALRTNSEDKKEVNGTEFKVKTNLSTIFINAYYDIDTGTAFTPFLGVGIGMTSGWVGASETGDDPTGGTYGVSGDNTSTSLAYNVGLGVSYAFTENVAADLGYRFIGAGYHDGKISSPSAEMKFDTVPYIHELYLGARISF